MRVMILAKSTPATENASRSAEGFEPMARFHQELTDAGVLLASGALQPTSKAKRIRYERKRQTITDGPFTESKELIGGYWIWEVTSLDEAIEWLKRAPFPEGPELEIRPIGEGDYLVGR